MKSFLYSAATLFVLLMAFILIWFAFAPDVHLPKLAAVIIGGLLGIVSIVIGNLLAEKAS